MSDSVSINRENKSLLFCFIFGSEENKKHLLSLYNAVNNTNYTNVDDVEINTLSDIIYIRMKNDVSFILDSDMSLYEHQSTFNPNMPLRGMMYFSTLYSQFISENHKNIYGKTLVKIPTPRYIVFYNGNDSYPDRLNLKLSDAFERPDGSGHFEWTATMLNINKGHNQEIMDKCQALSQYSDFIAKVKEYNRTLPIRESIDLAVEYAISNNYLDGFFQKHREGIMLSCLTEFNEEVFRKGIHEEGFAEGHASGLAEGHASGLAEGHASGLAEGLAEGHASGLAEGHAKERQESIIKAIEMSKAYKVSKEDAIQQLIVNYKLTEAEAIKAVDKHWK